MLTIIVYGEDIIMSLIRYDEKDIVNVVKIDKLGWVGYPLKCRNWALAEGLLYLNKKTLGV
jgi:hypothetical protein